MTRKTIPMLAIAAISAVAILGFVSANTDHAASAATGGTTPWASDIANLQTTLQNMITNNISDESTARKAGDAALSTQITDLSNLVANPPPKPDKTNAFLAIDGIEGESTDANHPKTIEIESWSFGETQPITTSSGGGGGAGKVSFQDLHFVTKTVDKSSPKLFLAGASGEHIKDATLFVRKAGSNSDYLQIKLTDVLVSSYQTGGSGGDNPTESFSLNFAKVQYSYTGTDADGKLLPAIDVGWDLLANKVS